MKGSNGTLTTWPSAPAFESPTAGRRGATELGKLGRSRQTGGSRKCRPPDVAALAPTPPPRWGIVVGPALCEPSAHDVGRADDRHERPSANVVETVRDGRRNEGCNDEPEHCPELGGEQGPLGFVMPAGDALARSLHANAGLFHSCHSNSFPRMSGGRCPSLRFENPILMFPSPEQGAPLGLRFPSVWRGRLYTPLAVVPSERGGSRSRLSRIFRPLLAETGPHRPNRRGRTPAPRTAGRTLR